MTQLQAIVRFLDQELNIEKVPDYPGAINGLQLENSGKVTKVGAAVDASLPVIEKAISDGVDLLVVHHGMFWQGAQPVTKANFKKLKSAIDGDMAIYSAHIPLDIHLVLGNNALLAKALGITDTKPFFLWKGIELGISGNMDLSLSDLEEKITEVLKSPVHICPGGDSQVGRVGIITGGAGSEVAAVHAEGINTFITGEGPHWTYPMAEELGINLIYAGHYATETFGVIALAEELARLKKLEWVFIDHPTGL
ncbi:MAG: Nif3-like dinuclear metal center hexameric protein [Akkermansiaceae bacterium]